MKNWYKTDKQNKHENIYGIDISYDSSLSLYDYSNDNGGYVGLMGTLTDCRFFSEGHKQFIYEQFKRFNVPLFEGIEEVFTAGALATSYTVDFVTPYCWFTGITDVQATLDWHNHTYIIDGDELDPNEIESFEYVPNQTAETFIHCMSNPGLSQIPNEIGEEIDWYLFEGDHRISDAVDTLSVETMRELDSVCQDGDEYNIKMFKNYFKLSAWSTFCWLLSPEGMEYLSQRHDIIGTVLEYGECIIHQHMIYPKGFYTKINRPPQCCLHCGIRAWCSEETLVDGGLSYICESCSNGGMPPLAPYMCGTKFCKYSQCPNHPYHGQDKGGINYTQSQYGYLTQKARKQILPHAIPGQTNQPLLA